MDLQLALIAGVDIPFEGYPLILHQPKINEIAYIGTTDFFQGTQTLCLYKSMFSSGEDINQSEELTNFDIFMTIMNEKTTVEKKQAVIKVFSLLCPNYKCLFTPMSVILQAPEKETVILDKDNFESFQYIVRQIFCISEGPMDQSAFNPEGALAKSIAEKLMKGRERIAAEKKDEDGNLISRYISSLTVGLHSMSLFDLLNCTLFQLYDLIQRYALWMNFDLDTRARLAGGKPDKEPENWMKNIH